MKKLLVIAFASLIASGMAFADCAGDATAKKLAGAAKTSFLKKCEADAMAAAPKDDAVAKCDAMAADKKLAGAAKTSFTKKCIADAAAAAGKGAKK